MRAEQPQHFEEDQQFAGSGEEILSRRLSNKKSVVKLKGWTSVVSSSGNTLLARLDGRRLSPGSLLADLEATITGANRAYYSLPYS